jgi:hypothetical protein
MPQCREVTLGTVINFDDECGMCWSDPPERKDKWLNLGLKKSELKKLLDDETVVFDIKVDHYRKLQVYLDKEENLKEN